MYVLALGLVPAGGLGHYRNIKQGFLWTFRSLYLIQLWVQTDQSAVVSITLFTPESSELSHLHYSKTATRQNSVIDVQTWNYIDKSRRLKLTVEITQL